MVEQGRQIFRFDTFGSEAFCGDALQLHQAIAGERNGGVGAGVSPKTALAVGLKVDADALPADLKRADQGRQGRPRRSGDDARAAQAERGRRRDRHASTTAGKITSIGIQCALCHSTVDDSFAPGIGKRLDGWANRDLNVGAIVSLAPNLKPFTDLLGVDEATVKKVLASWGPGRFDAELDKDGKAFRPDGKQARHADSARVRPRRREPAHLDRLGLGPVLERVRRRDRDARLGHVLRPAPATTPTSIPVAAKSGSVNTRGTPDLRHGEAAGAALLPARDPRAQAARRQLRRGGRRARQGGVQRQRRSARPATCRRSSPSPGRTCTRAAEIGIDAFQADRSPDAHVPHGAARRPVDAPEGRLLPRRPLRDAGATSSTTTTALRARAERRRRRAT